MNYHRGYKCDLDHGCKITLLMSIHCPFCKMIMVLCHQKCTNPEVLMFISNSPLPQHWQLLTNERRETIWAGRKGSCRIQNMGIIRAVWCHCLPFNKWRLDPCLWLSQQPDSISVGNSHDIKAFTHKKTDNDGFEFIARLVLNNMIQPSRVFTQKAREFRSLIHLRRTFVRNASI